MLHMRDIVRSAAFLFVPFLAFGEVLEVDVMAWADLGTGMTNGWEVSGIDRYSAGEGGYTRLNTKDDYVISPDFTNVVTQVVMRVKCSNVGTERFLTLTPTISQDGARCQAAVPSVSMMNETFTWTLSEDVRGFRLQNDTGKGTVTWTIASLTVFCTPRIEPPTGLREDTLYRDAFAAVWGPAPKAVRYQIQYGSLTRIPPSYETVAKWNFSSLTNAMGNSKDLEDLREKFPNVLDGVTGANLGLQKYDGGHLQIGKDNVAGAMELQLDAAVSSRICFLTNWRHGKDSSSGCSAFCLCEDGSTNEVIALTAGASPATDRFALPDGTCTLRVESPKSRRVEILSVIVATDYDPGSVTTNEFKMIGARATEKVVKDLAPGEWQWAARSFDAEGRGSPWSPFRTVILDREMACWPCPGFGIMIR